jgi:hypothetical protein
LEEQIMRVRVVVELDIEPDELSPDLPALYTPEQLRQAARDAVVNALFAAEADGFSHDLEHDTAVVVAAVHLLSD